MLKRLFDISFSLLGLLILSPLLVILALLIALNLGRPVLFTQVRPGLHGRPFRILKFRTMTNARNAQGQLLPNEHRKSALGDLLRSASLDELPELINVLRGEMSLVGPRPLLMEYLPHYNDFQARRHEVRPGITGWAQVNGRNAIGWEQKFELDVWYIDNQSFLLDIKILWMTLLKVIRREGINASGGGFTEPFKGNKDQSV
ncbi:MAG TPA: sugar transferase [Bacteroidales bacterium]|nr:sugar transferase [Bacteroidales bacterium]